MNVVVVHELCPRSRISRSLLSYGSAGDNLLEETRRYDSDNGTVRRHSHKSKHRKRRGRKRSRSGKKRTKNKFILKIMRTLMNGTEEHLEVDIHCKHRQLFPNNSFVRDLVTILNDKNVKVVNNGRVFERNKVTELEPAAPHKVLHKMDIEPPDQPLAPVAVAQMREGIFHQLKQRMKKQKPGVQSGAPESGEGDSAEDAPLLDDSMDRSSGREDWPIGESRFRRKQSYRRGGSLERPRGPAGAPPERSERPERAHDEPHIHSVGCEHDVNRKDFDIEYLGDDAYRGHNASGEAAPVKVVMRSNLTFNLGDEFFKWRNRHADDIVSEFLGDLTIPGNSSDTRDRHDSDSSSDSSDE
uniref:Uncharacterized protein n=1 Tax=Heliothis virescens TaxID=7102 RepID=A0A2A4JZ63_HELVI